MQRAGAATAAEIALRFPDEVARGVLVLVGAGNNGGDGWVLARALAATGVRVRVCEAMPVNAPDAAAERVLAIEHVELVLPSLEKDAVSNAEIYRGEGVVVDAVLGTGASGPPRGGAASVVRGLKLMRERGAKLVAVDVPTGVDATTGEVHTTIRYDVTFTYGTLKRGHLLARAVCGRVVVLDVGLRLPADDDRSPELVSGAWVASRLPDIPADAHKGTKKKLAIIGGAPGMTGAAILAARGAWRSGVGMVKLVVAEESLAAVQEAEPQSLTGRWPVNDTSSLRREIVTWADVVAIGPGLGGGTAARSLVERVLGEFAGPVVLDADAINAFSADVNALGRMLGKDRAVLTPHPAEFARLSGIAVDDVLKRRFEVGLPVARHTGAAVLLKGQPTIVSAPSGEVLVSASGTPLLAAAGSGDLLTGMVATLLGQTEDPLVAAAAGAYVHGRAAWLAQKGRGIRGLSLDDVIAALPRAWRLPARPSRSPVLFELPAIV